MASLAKKGVEPLFHGILLPALDLTCVQISRKDLNIMMLSTSLDVERGGLTEMVALRV